MNTPIEMKKLCHRFNSTTSRIDKIFCIAAIIADQEIMPEDFQDFIEDQGAENVCKIFGDLPDTLIDYLEDYGPTAVLEQLYLYSKFGFLIQFATPCVTHQGKAKMYSWGYYNTAWFYADTLDEAIEKGFAWVENLRKKESGENV